MLGPYRKRSYRYWPCTSELPRSGRPSTARPLEADRQCRAGLGTVLQGRREAQTRSSLIRRTRRGRAKQLAKAGRFSRQVGLGLWDWPCGQQFRPQESKDSRSVTNAPGRQTQRRAGLLRGQSFSLMVAHAASGKARPLRPPAMIFPLAACSGKVVTARAATSSTALAHSGSSSGSKEKISELTSAYVSIPVTRRAADCRPTLIADPRSLGVAGGGFGAADVTSDPPQRARAAGAHSPASPPAPVL